MPLSLPEPRNLLHRRRISCDAYQRKDGLWDIEARMTDTKTHAAEVERGRLEAGDAFHDISLRLTIDAQRVIQAVSASIDASPFLMCPQITGAFAQLQGIRIGRGWLKEAASVVGGVKGCTHLNELLPVIATTAIQALWSAVDEKDKPAALHAVLNTCHTWSQGSPVIQRLSPGLHTPERAGGELRE